VAENKTIKKVVILKYPLNQVGATRLALPVFAKELAVQNQRESLVLWVEAPVFEGGHNGATGSRDYWSLMTGQPFDLPAKAEFVGTAQFSGGSFVVHVYGGK